MGERGIKVTIRFQGSVIIRQSDIISFNKRIRKRRNIPMTRPACIREDCDYEK